MIQEIRKDIYKIEVPLPNNPLRILDSYFIRGEDHDTLIDTGFRQPECFEALASALEELGSDPDRRDVIVTHLHSDHSGMAELFAGEKRRIYMSETDLSYQRAFQEDNFADKTVARFVQEGFPQELALEAKKTHPGWQYGMKDVYDPRFTGVEDGEKIPVGDGTLEVVLVPGHTPGNMMLWDAETKTMFTGDHVLFDITPNITFWLGFHDSLGHYLDSLRRTQAFPVETALPGHRMSGDYHARIEALLLHHQARLAETHRIIREMPGLTAYEIASHMKWRIRADSWETFPITQKWFAVGECLSHLDYLRERGKISREEGRGAIRYTFLAE